MCVCAAVAHDDDNDGNDKAIIYKIVRFLNKC